MACGRSRPDRVLCRRPDTSLGTLVSGRVASFPGVQLVPPTQGVLDQCLLSVEIRVEGGVGGPPRLVRPRRRHRRTLLDELECHQVDAFTGPSTVHQSLKLTGGVELLNASVGVNNVSDLLFVAHRLCENRQREIELSEFRIISFKI